MCKIKRKTKKKKQITNRSKKKKEETLPQNLRYISNISNRLWTGEESMDSLSLELEAFFLCWEREGDRNSKAQKTQPRTTRNLDEELWMKEGTIPKAANTWHFTKYAKWKVIVILKIFGTFLYGLQSGPNFGPLINDKFLVWGRCSLSI